MQTKTEHTKSGDIRPWALALGGMQEYGHHVTLFMEHGTYAVRRSPYHCRGHFAQNYRTLTEARNAAKEAAKCAHADA
jgi:hypothetical protein